jgi:Mlc titration factor MtfA (ptsG expression regulator)
MADGFNEVIYEAVHCLDLLEGAVNGRLTFQGSVAIYSPRNHSWNFGRRKASP